MIFHQRHAGVRASAASVLGALILSASCAAAQSMTNSDLSKFALQWTDAGTLSSCTVQTRNGTPPAGGDSLYRFCEFAGAGGRAQNGVLSISDFGTEGALVQWELMRRSPKAANLFVDSLRVTLSKLGLAQRACRAGRVPAGTMSGFLWTGRITALLNLVRNPSDSVTISVSLVNNDDGLPLDVLCREPR